MPGYKCKSLSNFFKKLFSDPGCILFEPVSVGVKKNRTPE